MLLGLVGGLFLAWGAGSFLTGRQGEVERRGERKATLIAGLLFAAAFLAELVTRFAVH